MEIIRNKRLYKIRINYKSSGTITGWFSKFEFKFSNNERTIDWISAPDPNILKAVYNDIMKNRGNLPDEDLVQIYLKTVAMHSPDYLFINPKEIETITRLEIEEVDVIV